MPPLAANLLETEFPLFEEATQTAAHFLKVPICMLGIPHGNALVLKAAVGLSQLGLMNPLARTRRLPLDDELAHPVLHQQRRLVLPHITQEPFTQSGLVQAYGIQSYIGVPLLTADGTCLGLLAAMDIAPGEFSTEAIAFMELLARWSVSEYERAQLSEQLSEATPPVAIAPPAESATSLLDTVRLTLMSQLTQDMRNPLTTITGMASMLSREIYGPLTPKQREYAEIVRNSSQMLLEVATEVLEISGLDNNVQPLRPTSVDFEMIGQQVCKGLASVAQKYHQEIQLTVEPGSRLWTLDRDVVRHLLYHLTFSVIHLAKESGTVRIHGSERDHCLTIAVWVSHPWLGEGLPNGVVSLYQRLSNPVEEAEVLSMLLAQAIGQAEAPAPAPLDASENGSVETTGRSREILSLLLSRHLIARHGGNLTLQGNPDSGYRFLISLPPISRTA